MSTITKTKKALTQTQKVIQSQLLENTGTNMLDSGGAYGRAWQRNQKTGIDFNAQVQVDKYGFTIPVQLYMSTMLERDAECSSIERLLTRELPKLVKDGNSHICYWNGPEIIDILKSRDYEFDNEDWSNTYNGDCDLSQTLQMLVFKKELGDYYVIIETHNGCDVRGGYSTGRVYRIRDIDYFIMGIVISQFSAQDEKGKTIKEWESQYQMMNDCTFEESSNTWVYQNRAISYYSEAEGY